MIDWDITFEKFGTTESTTRSKDKVIVLCDKCGIQSDRVLCSIKQTIKQKGYYHCHSCATKNSEFKNGCSKRAKLKWQDPVYINNNLAVVLSDEYRNSQKIKAIECWSDPEFRSKMMTPAMSMIRKKNSSISAKALWAKPEYRSKLVSQIRTRMKRIWLNEDYRKHMNLIQSENTKYLWSNGSFDDCFDDEFAIKMTPINREILSRPEVLTKLSKASKKNWENSFYRNNASNNSRKNWANQDYRNKMAVIRASQPSISTQQILLYKLLDDLKINYEKESKETAIGYYVFDCMIPKQGIMTKSLLIECQGDYWHSLEETQSKDKAKFTYIDRYFPEYEIIYIWEHEFYTKDRVLDRLKLKLGLSIETIDFDLRDLIIKQVASSDIKSFLDAYHYIGKGRGGKAFGVYHDDKLIACSVFSPPLRQNMDGFGEFRELSRFCIHPSYHKKNFASWFLGKSLKLIKDKIVTYSDTTVGHTGSIYKASNFKLHHEVQSDYWYIDKDGYVMHKRTLYGRAIKMSMTESDFAVKYGYVKKYGGPKLCFVYDNL